MKIYFLKKYDIKPSFIISATLLIIVISSIIYGSFVIYNQKKSIYHFCIHKKFNTISNFFSSANQDFYKPDNKFKWSVLMVGYNSSVYLKWQLKILYEFNNPQNFELIIIDNSVNKDEEKILKKLIAEYQNKYKNIKLVFYKPRNKTASGQHGEALEYAKQFIKGKYLLVHDPDFFWLQKNYLNIFEKELQNNVVVGAPYNKMYPNFPSAYGSAYQYDKIKNISFEAYIDGDFNKSWNILKKNIKDNKINPDSDFIYDVGWQIRNQLTKDPQNSYLTFNQYFIAKNILKIFNFKDLYSYELVSSAYFYKNKLLAFHLFRGNFTGKLNEFGEDPKLTISQKTWEIRNKISENLYNQISNDQNSFYKFYCESFKK